MKKILFSLGIIVFLGAGIAGGTIAFYSDTETSNGNIFVAGSIDLTVDHTYASYNDEECFGMCIVDVYSNATDVVNGDFASLTWVHPNWTSIPGSFWIWDDYYVQDPTNDETYVFTKSFEVAGLVYDAVIDIAADNGYRLVINGIEVDDRLDIENNFSSIKNYDITSLLVSGSNELEVTVKNFGMPGGTPTSNPAGLLYRLQTKSNCGGEYTQTPGASCELWMEQNLGSETFFNFGDVKPGDRGLNVISLHSDGNDAWVCAIIHDDDDQENTLIDPELEYGDLPDVGNLLGFGELSNYLDIFAWEDINNNGVYEPGTENNLYEGSIQTEIIQMQLTGDGPTEYLGFSWCAGSISVDHNTGEIICDGHGMYDDAQTDSFLANLTLYAEQVRNNVNFLCSEVDLTED